MIQYLKPVRSRHKPASLSLRSRRATVAELLGWASGIALGAVVTPPARTTVLELLVLQLIALWRQGLPSGMILFWPTCSHG